MADDTPKRKLFGTDGVRGVANTEPITCEIVQQLGRAAGHFFRSTDNRRHKILVGKDTRLSGYMLEMALISGICSMGCDAIMTGPLPTPGIAFLTQSMRADAGVVISASHNPYQDNGIKFFSSNGFKLPDSSEAEMEQLIGSAELTDFRPTGSKIGKAWRIDDAVGRYVVFCKSTFPKQMVLDGLTVVLDTANGAAYRCAQEVFSELGAKVIQIGNEPDGFNINSECGAQLPEKVQQKVLETGADIGIALDGDADRCILVDNKGRIFDGDRQMALCALELQSKGELAHDTVVATVMSNLGFEKALTAAGITLIRAAVGDRYVVEKMVEGGFNFGGEQSGHVIYLDHNTTGDGIISALQVLAVMVGRQKPLSDFYDVMTTLPQVLINVEVGEKRPFEESETIVAAVKKIERELGDSGRLLLRYSGTENKARVMMEGEDETRIGQQAQELAQLIEKEFGSGTGDK
jgi:phosphoglucosamine mutase